MSGVVWAILAGIGFGLFQSFHRQTSRQMDTYLATFVLVVVSFIVLLAVVILRREAHLLWQMPIMAMVWFGLSGLVHFFFGWTFLSASQKRIGAARTSALVGATPLFASLLAVLFLNETLTGWQLGGILMIVAGVYFVTSK